MIFLTAQPDTYYFLWQLELQLFNFSRLGIAKENIHVLIGYHPAKGLSTEFKELIAKNTAGTFFTYADERESKAYLSSIRPHIIKKHIAALPHLQHEVIFYHDSDIIFRQMPVLPADCSYNKWYVSDTRSYLDSNYILANADEDTFLKMCAVVGVPPSLVVNNDKNAGGAQYLLKGASYTFWDKIERDSENIYTLLCGYNRGKGEVLYISSGAKISKYHGIQAWCADMWALLWNAAAASVDVNISEQLDFCWPYEDTTQWEEKNILHYAGVTKNNAGTCFFKGQYVHYAPYYDDFHLIDNRTCSLPLIQLIKSYANTLEQTRIDLQDVTFMILIRVDSEDRRENMETIIKYLNKYFITNIILLEADEETKLGATPLPENVKYVFVKDSAPLLHRTRWNTELAKLATTPIVAIYDTDVVFSPAQIETTVNNIRSGRADYAVPFDGEFVCIDKLFKKIFMKILDTELLFQNTGKFSVSSKRSFGGAAFIKRQVFINAGFDNINITSWGPEDIERQKRMKILGYKVVRTKGPLFHLHHKRGINSLYNNETDRIKLMEEYLRVTSMRRKELEAYIPNLQISC
jgi:hypothetical protein